MKATTGDDMNITTRQTPHLGDAIYKVLNNSTIQLVLFKDGIIDWVPKHFSAEVCGFVRLADWADLNDWSEGNMPDIESLANHVRRMVAVIQGA